MVHGQKDRIVNSLLPFGTLTLLLCVTVSKTPRPGILSETLLPSLLGLSSQEQRL